MILGDFTRILETDLGATPVTEGDARSSVGGLAVDEEGSGWLEPDEAAVTRRAELEPQFLDAVRGAGAPVLVWRRNGDSVPKEVLARAEKLGLGLYLLPPEVPLRRLLNIFSGDSGLLLHSHGAVRALLDSTGGETSISDLAKRISGLLGREVVVEDPVGRILADGRPENSGDGAGQSRQTLASLLEEHGLRASRGSGIEETRRERRDRYARLPDGFLSVPVERWRVGGNEFFWMPVGSGAPAGYLWLDLVERPIGPEDVVLLYWARHVMEAALGRERVRLETELGVRGDFIDDLITGHFGSLELVLQRARYLGADLSQGAMAIIVDIDDFARYLERRRLSEPAIQELKRRLADAVRLQARQIFSNFLSGPRSDNVILFVSPSETERSADLSDKARLLATRVQRYVKGLLPDLTISIGIGRYTADPALLPDAYSEAEVTLEIGHRINGPASISTFENTGTYKLLFRVLQDNPEELETFYNETLESAVAYDSRYGTDLVHTLLTYLRNDASTVKTAGELFAHRHTIRYRLDRLRELTSLDVDRSEDRERITLGIKAMQLLGHAPTEHSSFNDR